MYPQDSGGAQRRPLDVEDYIDIVRRHKSWIFGPAFAALVIATVVAYVWPDTYVSTGVIRVVPPKVPENLIQSNLNQDLQGRFNSMVQGLTSRETLRALISDFNLYPNDRKRLPDEDIIEKMRQKDIRIAAVPNLSANVNGKNNSAAFQIGFAYTNARIAQKVAEKLVGEILTENTRETSQTTKQTTEFIQASWEDAKNKLDQIETHLSTFRQRNIGRLPEDQQSNFNRLTALQTTLFNLSTSMGRINQDKLLMENQLKIYKDQLSQLKDPTPQDQVTAKQNEKLIEKDREITAYENALAQARERYKESHPDVQMLAGKVALLKKQREEIVKQASEDEAKKPDKPEKPVVRPVSPEFAKRQEDLGVAIKHMQAGLDAKDLEMQGYQKQETALEGELRTIQERLAAEPVGLKDYEELVRDREMAKREYEELDKKLKNSKLSTEVITSNQGETLEVLEMPSLPETPTEPKRPIIILAGAMMGIVLGLFLAGAREIKDTSLKNLKDVRAYTQLPIIGSIPLLENDLIVRRRRRLAWVGWATAGLVGIVIMSSTVVYYYSKS